MERKTLTVDILLKDGTWLYDCAIFPEDIQHGQPGYTTVQEINDAFNKVLWGKKYIAFQNKLINGHVHVNNVDTYQISN